MKKYLEQLTIFFILCMVLSSCVDLKHINDYSQTSLQGITSFEELNYSFEQNCIDRCISTIIQTLEINAVACDCKIEKTADSTALKIYTALNGYFDGLSKLSNKEYATYKTDDLETTLTENDLGSFKIEKKHMESYSKISTIIMRTFTDSYSRKKIKNYIKEANQPILELISFLDFIVSSNLYGKLNVQKSRIKSIHFDFIHDPSLSTLEKQNLVINYYSKIFKIEQQQKRINNYSKVLQKITKGHQQLFDNIDQLTDKEIKQALFQYASEIKSIISESKKIR